MSAQPPPNRPDAERRDAALDADPQPADASSEVGVDVLPRTSTWVRVRPFVAALVVMLVVIGGLHAWGQVAATHDDPVAATLAAARDAVLHSLSVFSPSGRAAAPVAVAEAAPPAPTATPGRPPTATNPPPPPTAAPTHTPLPSLPAPPLPLALPPVVEAPRVAARPPTVVAPPVATAPAAPPLAAPVATRPVPQPPVIRPAAPPPATGAVKPAAPGFSKPVDNGSAWLRRAPAAGVQPAAPQPARLPVVRAAPAAPASGPVKPTSPGLSKPAENTSGWLRPSK